MKMTLIKVKESEQDSRKHENDTHEREGVEKRQFEKLTKIEVQRQPTREYCR